MYGTILSKANMMISSCLIALIKFYRFGLGLLLRNHCRFEPSCSAYSIEAIQTQGWLKGCFLTVKRLLCCHPWHAGGFDPVPNGDKNK